MSGFHTKPPSDNPDRMLLADVCATCTCSSWSAIYFDNAQVCFFRSFSQDKRLGICILFTHPTAILDSLLYLSEEAFIYSQLPERFVLLPRVSWSAKYVVLRILHPPPGHFDTRHEHDVVQTAKTFALTWREGDEEERLGDNKRKRTDGGRWRRAKVTLL